MIMAMAVGNSQAGMLPPACSVRADDDRQHGQAVSCLPRATNSTLVWSRIDTSCNLHADDATHAVCGCDVGPCV